MNRTTLTTRSTYLLLAVCVLALVASLSGTAYALGKGSVTSKAIKNGAVRTPDLAADAVAGEKVRDGSLRGADVADGSLTGNDVADGTLGGADLTDSSVTTGDLAAGAVRSGDIAAGAVGAGQLAAITTVRNTTSSITDPDGTTNGGQYGSIYTRADCPAGTRAISGGALWVDPSSGEVDDKNLYLHSSYRLGNSWFARGIVDTGAQGNVKFEVYVDCLAVAGP